MGRLSLPGLRAGADVELRSRHDRPLGRYFPELVEGFRELPLERFVLDGEIVVAGPGGLDFDALLARVHPAASRVERLSRETPATFVAFDVIAREDDDLRERSFRSAAVCSANCFRIRRRAYVSLPPPRIPNSLRSGWRSRAPASTA